MNIPFGLKQKPLNHYFQNGVIRFSVKEGNLYFKVIQINPKFSATIFDYTLIKTKEQLDKLLSIRYVSEIPTIEVVQQ